LKGGWSRAKERIDRIIGTGAEEVLITDIEAFGIERDALIP
jgi:hypothetical protein